MQEYLPYLKLNSLLKPLSGRVHDRNEMLRLLWYMMFEIIFAALCHVVPENHLKYEISFKRDYVPQIRGSFWRKIPFSPQYYNMNEGI